MKGLLESFNQIKQLSHTWSKMLVLGSLSLGIFFIIKACIPAEKNMSVETQIVEKKGFELFDDISFLKGDKELHILQMRALKGELEKELVLFDNIEKAHVILELPEPALFDVNESAKTKASLLLTLKPDTHLTCSQLKAISSHVAGAVRGLEPNQIAISDTTGKFYQGFEGVVFPAFTKTAIEEDIKPKIEKFLEKLLGKTPTHLTINMNVEEKVLGLSLLIDHPKEMVSEEILKQQVSHLLANLMPGVEVKSLIHRQPFYKAPLEEKQSAFFSFSILLLVCVLVLSISALILFSSRFFQKKHNANDGESPRVEYNAEDISSMMKKVNFTTLSSLIQEQPPSTIALMLSYLDKERQEALLSKLPPSVHDEVLFYLAQRGDV